MAEKSEARKKLEADLKSCYEKWGEGGEACDEITGGKGVGTGYQECHSTNYERFKECVEKAFDEFYRRRG